MSATRVHVGEDRKTIVITAPKVANDAFKLSFPEFHAKDENGPFAIREILELQEAEKDAKIRFGLSGQTKDLGIEFKGSVTAQEGEVLIDAKLRNVRSEAIHNGHHSVLLDLSEAPSFDDRTGERTYLYAETGWASIAQLLDPIHTHEHTIHIGAAHNKITVMWKMIARFDFTRRYILAMGLDKGYVFASDHEDWGRGLLGGFRWGAVNTQETKPMLGKIYFFCGTLDDLRRRYNQDFK